MAGLRSRDDDGCAMVAATVLARRGHVHGDGFGHVNWNGDGDDLESKMDRMFSIIA